MTLPSKRQWLKNAHLYKVSAAGAEFVYFEDVDASRLTDVALGELGDGRLGADEWLLGVRAEHPHRALPDDDPTRDDVIAAAEVAFSHEHGPRFIVDRHEDMTHVTVFRPDLAAPPDARPDPSVESDDALRAERTRATHLDRQGHLVVAHGLRRAVRDLRVQPSDDLLADAVAGPLYLRGWARLESPLLANWTSFGTVDGRRVLLGPHRRAVADVAAMVDPMLERDGSTAAEAALQRVADQVGWPRELVRHAVTGAARGTEAMRDAHGTAVRRAEQVVDGTLVPVDALADRLAAARGRDAQSVRFELRRTADAGLIVAARLALTTLVPAFQFADDGHLRRSVGRINLRLFHDEDLTAWQAWSWWDARRPMLGGACFRDADETVLDWLADTPMVVGPDGLASGLTDLPAQARPTDTAAPEPAA